jgi:hypothetical protein
MRTSRGTSFEFDNPDAVPLASRRPEEIVRRWAHPDSNTSSPQVKADRHFAGVVVQFSGFMALPWVGGVKRIVPLHESALLEWCENASEDHPSERCLCDEAQGDVHLLPIEVVLPLADTFVLKDHVEREYVEQHEVDYEYQIHEC